MARSSIPRSDIAAYALSTLRWLRPMPLRPVSTVSMTVREKTSGVPEGTNVAILEYSLSDMSSRSLPSTSILPVIGDNIFIMHFTSVDFPTPFGPIMQ